MYDERESPLPEVYEEPDSPPLEVYDDLEPPLSEAYDDLESLPLEVYDVLESLLPDVDMLKSRKVAWLKKGLFKTVVTSYGLGVRVVKWSQTVVNACPSSVPSRIPASPFIEKNQALMATSSWPLHWRTLLSRGLRS